jgi:hypothetical protein
VIDWTSSLAAEMGEDGAEKSQFAAVWTAYRGEGAAPTGGNRVWL